MQHSLIYAKLLDTTYIGLLNFIICSLYVDHYTSSIKEL